MIGNVTKLNHFRHVHHMSACAAHVKPEHHA
jgi:hypothetical protein